MREWTTYRLEPKPGAGFHFGLRGLEQEVSGEYCPSDTLFAALVSVLAGVEGPEAVDAFTKPFEQGRPRFLLASAFPRIGGLPLFPLPAARVELTPQRGRRNLIKRLRYVSPAILRRILERQPMDGYASRQGAFLHDGMVWIAAEEIEGLPEGWDRRRLRERKVWSSMPVDRVTVDRVTSASAVFRTGRTVFAPGCGLWLGVQWAGGADPALQAQLETLLAYLGDQGLGGERSVGYGQFTVGRDPLPLDLPDVTPDGPALTLSRYLPAAGELPAALQGAASYRLVAVPGWLSAPARKAQRRRQVRMLAEGSLFYPAGPPPWGHLADVRPAGWDGHPIWRYGYACPVGIRPEEKTDA